MVSDAMCPIQAKQPGASMATLQKPLASPPLVPDILPSDTSWSQQPRPEKYYYAARAGVSGAACVWGGVGVFGGLLPFPPQGPPPLPNPPHVSQVLTASTPVHSPKRSLSETFRTESEERDYPRTMSEHLSESWHPQPCTVQEKWGGMKSAPHKKAQERDAG